MNTTDDDLARALADGLAHQASRLDGSAPLAFEDVRGRARRIRRNRGLVAVAGAAAVVALVLPLGVLAGGQLTRGDRPPVVDTPSVTRVEDPTDPAEPTDAPTPSGRETARIDGLPTGAPPATGHLADGVAYDGAGEPLERIAGAGGELTGRAELADGTVVETTDGHGGPAVAVGAGGTTYGPFPGRGLVVNPERTVVAWMDGATVRAWQAGGSEPLEIGTAVGVGEVPGLVALTGVDCTGGEGCVAYGNGDDPTDGSKVPFALAAGGAQPLPLDGIRTVTDVRGDRLAGVVSVSDDGTCSVLRDGASVVGRTCEAYYDAFSPDADLVLTSNAYKDGIGDGEVGFADASGTPLFSRVSGRSAPFFHAGGVWEDSRHVLVAAHSWSRGTWAIVRIGVDGTMEYAVPPRPGQDMDFPFAFPAAP